MFTGLSISTRDANPDPKTNPTAYPIPKPNPKLTLTLITLTLILTRILNTNPKADLFLNLGPRYL